MISTWGLRAAPVVSAAVESAASGAAEPGLVINEVAAQGDPLDWVELYNVTETEVALSNYVLADDLTDVGKRAPFPTELVIGPPDREPPRLE